MATATGTITDNDTVAATVTANRDDESSKARIATFTVDLGAGDRRGEPRTSWSLTTPIPTRRGQPCRRFRRLRGTGRNVDNPRRPRSMGTIAITTNRDDLQEGVETLRVTLTSSGRPDAGTVNVTGRRPEMRTATTGHRRSREHGSRFGGGCHQRPRARPRQSLSACPARSRSDLTISYDTRRHRRQRLRCGRTIRPPLPATGRDSRAGMTTGTITVATLEDEDNGAEDTPKR